MFGYVTVARNQLTEDEYESFRACYCGLCRAMGRAASHLSRFGLSYDIAFLALVLSSVTDEEVTERCDRCMAHPIKRRRYMVYDPVLEYCASAGVILGYAKLDDDRRDDRSIKAALGMLALRNGFNRSRKRCADVYEAVKFRLDRLSWLERDRCPVIDEAAEEFGRITEKLFTPGFIENEKDRRALAWFGYNLGRWIYIIDAYNDYEDDLRTGSYNPLIAADNADVNEIEMSLTLTLNNIASAFELIDFKRNRDIIGKIVYISLKQKQNNILNKDVDE